MRSYYRRFAVFVLLVMAAAGLHAAAQEKAAPLTAQQIIRNFEKAVGKDAYLKLTTRVTKGTITIRAANLSGTFEGTEKAPNDMVVTFSLEGVGTFREGCNGKTAWSVTPEGIKDATGAELDEKLRDCEFHGDVKMLERYPTLKYIGVRMVEGREAHAIEGGGPNRRTETFYFDAQTWLEVRREIPSDGETAAVTLGDYRDVDGIKFPFLVSESKSGMVMRIQQVRHNVAVDPAVFRKPAAN